MNKHRKLIANIAIVLCYIAVLWQPALAAPPTPGAAAESIRASLVQAQLALNDEPQEARALVDKAYATYKQHLAPVIITTDRSVAQRIKNGLDQLLQASAAQDAVAFAADRSQVWTTLLAASYHISEQALATGDAATALQWLAVREFRTATRFSRPNADATLAVTAMAKGTMTPANAVLTMRADLLDTYQARLTEALRNLDEVDSRGFAMRRAELAALAEGYFAILAPAYGEQKGDAARQHAEQIFAHLRSAALTNTDLDGPRQSVEEALHNFRAAPLSPAEQARRAGQLLRYLTLVPVEYGRGVVDGHVTKGLEIQEAITFHEGAQAAFADLHDLLNEHSPQQTVAVEMSLADLNGLLNATNTGVGVADPAVVRATVDKSLAILTEIMPAEWQQASAVGDFDVIAAMLDQMEIAVRAEDYTLAESARLEAYAVMETGPEARIMVFAPDLKLRLEDLFWNGQGEHKGLAFLLDQQASIVDIKASRTALDKELTSAQTLLAQSSAPVSVMGNATIIVFREGLEAVLILASLMGSMKLNESRRYRKPLWWGVVLALSATVLTWQMARGVLLALARYGEKLEAIVSLIAIGVLLLITNWFFHKMYWNDWLAGFHTRKRQLLQGEAGLFLGLMALGFTSVYREGFETVIFLQALVLESGTKIVMSGVALGLLATVLVGFITFKVQARLPYKKMLIVTGVMIGAVLLIMVGNTVHVLQVIGWLPIHLIGHVITPTWLGAWLGLYPTWEGIGLQLTAAVFVIGSYYWAEHANHARRPHRTATPTNEVITFIGTTNNT